MNGPGKLLLFTYQDRGFKSYADNMINLSVNDTS